MSSAPGGEKKETARLARLAGMVGLFTTGSRVLGLVREAAFAAIFGRTAETDAFNIAYLIPNMLRRLLGEGALSIAFIPVFGESFASRGEADSRRLVRVAMTWFTLLLLVVCVIGAAAAPWIVRLMAPGFDAQTAELASSLLRVLFPFIFFIGLAAMAAGALNARKHFAAPAAAPIVLNIFVVLAILGLCPLLPPGWRMYGVAAGTLTGGAAMLWLHLAALGREGVPAGFEYGSDPAVWKMVNLMGHATVGVAVYYLNITVSRMFASSLDQGTITALYYSDRLFELPLGVIAVSIATVTLPSLSEKLARQEHQGFIQSLNQAMRLAIVVCIPAMTAMIVLRNPVVNLVYQRGRFSAADTLLVGEIFLYAGLGLWAVAGIRIVAPAFYAMQDTATPVKIAFAAFIVNGVCSWLLLGLGGKGLSLANSISSMVQLGLLMVLFWVKFPQRTGAAREVMTPLLRLWPVFWRTTAASLVMGGVLWPMTLLSQWSTGYSGLLDLLVKAGIFGGGCAAGGLVFAGVAKLLGVAEIDLVLRRVAGRLRRKSGRTG
ncbi:MAG: putative lipid II flippase MurJ [Myxococcota bacterium]|nr:putative lipid II flippase MurJ [Myxococcota bacterium]